MFPRVGIALCRAATGAVLVAAGCGSGRASVAVGDPSGARGSPKAGVVDLPPEWQGVFGPIEQYLYSASDPVRLELALRDSSSRVVARCMTKHGWAYTASTAIREEVRRDLLTEAFNTPLADDGFRRRWGYGISRGLVDDGPSEGAPADPNAKVYNGLSSQEQDQWDKDFPSCAEEGNKAVGLTGSRWSQLEQLRKTAAERAAADNRLSAATDAWRGCMSKAGYTVEQPALASQSLEQRARPLYEAGGQDKAGGKQLLDEELAQADADWSCRSGSLTPALQATRGTIERQVVEDNIDLLQQLRDDLRRAAAG